MTVEEAQFFVVTNAPAGTNLAIYDGTGKIAIGPQPLMGFGDTYVDIGTPGSCSRVSLPPYISRVTKTAGPLIQIFLA